MSYNGKYVSFVTVVESAFRDSGLDFIDYENAIEWTAKLMGLMGVPSLYVDKTTDGIDGNPYGLRVENFRCKLPDDLESISAIRRIFTDGSGNVTGYEEMIETSDIFHPTNIPSGSQNSNTVWNPLVNIDEFAPDTEEFVHTRSNQELDPIMNTSGIPSGYKLDHGYVFTNFEFGYVQLAYRGFPIDENGYPLIPDDAKFKEALMWFIINKIDMRNYRINPSPQNAAILNRSDQQVAWYIGAASNKSKIPSVDKMEAIKKMWLRSNPKINEHKNGFNTLNIQEQRYNGRRTR